MSCPHCGTAVKHGNRFACCAGCRLMFVGASAFDRHQRFESGSLVCLDPAVAVDKSGRAMFLDVSAKKGEPEGRIWALNPAEGAENPWAKDEVYEPEEIEEARERLGRRAVAGSEAEAGC